MPKQLLRIIDGKSLLRLAFERALAVAPAERILVVTGRSYLDAVADDLHELPAANLLGEPVGRDSLNAVAWPAAVLARRDPDAVIAQLTADQLIEPMDAFVAALNEAFDLAEQRPDALVTLGVVPTSPHTGYGYLQRGTPVEGHPTACVVAEFKEKPSSDVAEQYVASGNYWWNAGMFVWRAATLLNQLRALEPENHAAVLELAAQPERLDEIFPTLKKVSVDYAIMEPASQGEAGATVYAVALPIQWRDVGGFGSLYEVIGQDADDNAVSGLGVALASSGTLIMNHGSADHCVAVVGVNDLVVVHTPDATLVTTRDNAEQVKALVARVGEVAGETFI